MSWFSFAYAILKAIPIFDKWIRDFFAWYAIKEKQWFYEEITKAVTRAISTGETADLEKAIKSPKAGKPSGHDGVDTFDPDLN